MAQVKGSGVASHGAGGVVSRPGLFGRLGAAARMTVVSGPPGSGKTVLLRSWISAAGLAGHTAWVSVGRGERDPQRFWLSEVNALRATSAASGLVRALTAPDLDGWAIVERLLKDLASLGERLWLVVDDVHELGSDQALRQLELLVMRGPPELRVVLATRHDARLALHRLRLDGELAEIRADDLRFTAGEARELLGAAGVRLSETALGILYERTEGWAAGLRLSALSLAGHPDPEQFAAEFSGSERTVAEYLLAEVLDRQPERVRRLLLRNSVLDRISGELADVLTGGSGGGRMLQDLEEAINLGITEFWSARLEEADRHLEQGIALAREIGRPFLEFTGLAYQAPVAVVRSPLARATTLSWQAIELARRHGWTDEPAAGIPYMLLAAGLIWQDRLDEAESWIGRAERTIKAEAEPAAAMMTLYNRALLELARGRDHEVLTAFGAAERLAGRLSAPHYLLVRTRALQLHALVRLGEHEHELAEHTLAGLSEQDRDRAEIRIAAAALRLAQHDPSAATAWLAPVLDGSAPVPPVWLAHAFMLAATAWEALGDPAAAGRAVERTLDLAKPDGALAVFVLHPAPSLLERHARGRTAHAGLIAEILDLMAGRTSALAPAGPGPLREPLLDSEIRVLRYLPTNLTAPEIAQQLYLSPNTVKTHVRNLYAKLGTHRRAEAVERARALGLLAPAAREHLPCRVWSSHPSGGLGACRG